MPAQRFDTDVFVIGGGPAGIAAAIAARQRGLRAMVADILRPPIDKACGEGLMPDSIAELQRLGVLLDGYQQAGFRGIRFVGPENSVEANFPTGLGVGVRRTTLHRALVEHAQRCGVEFLWGTRVDGISDDSVILRDRRIKSRWIVGADGQHSLVRRWARLDRGREFERRLALRRHFTVAKTPEYVEIHWGDDSQAYLTPVCANEVCVAIITKRKMDNFETEVQRIPALTQALAGAHATTPVRGGVTVSNRLQRVCRGNVALVGDASGSVDAITGEGLALSFRHALALAEAMANDNLELYQKAHSRIQALPHFMRRAMLLMDKSVTLRRKTLAAFEIEPALFQRMLSVHVCEISVAEFGAGPAARFGWQLVNA